MLRKVLTPTMKLSLDQKTFQFVDHSESICPDPGSISLQAIELSPSVHELVDLRYDLLHLRRRPLNERVGTAIGETVIWTLVHLEKRGVYPIRVADRRSRGPSSSSKPRSAPPGLGGNPVTRRPWQSPPGDPQLSPDQIPLQLLQVRITTVRGPAQAVGDIGGENRRYTDGDSPPHDSYQIASDEY